MRVTVDRHRLHEVLRHARRIARDDRKRLAFPALATVRLDVEDQEVVIAATNLETSLRMRCWAQVAEPGSVCLSARTLGEIVERLPNAPVTLASEGDSHVRLHCRQTRFRLRQHPVEDFPEIPVIPDAAQSLPTESLAHAIKRVIFAASSEDSRPALVGVRMEYWDDEFLLVATDGHRLAFFGSVNLPSERRGCLIPREAMGELLRLIAQTEAETVRFAQDDHYVYFWTNRWELIARQIVERFPPFEQFIQIRDCEMHARVEVAPFRDSCHRARALADKIPTGGGRHFYPIVLAFSEQGLAVTAGAGDDEAVEELACEVAGKPKTLAFNVEYLLDFLDVVRDGTVEVRVQTEQHPVLWRPVGESYLYLLMPMALDRVRGKT